MPVQIPLYEEFLWKGKIQLANYPEARQGPPFILPKVNTLTGLVVDKPTIENEMNRTYNEYSKKYWANLRKRHEAYRTKMLYVHYSYAPSAPSMPGI
jgi:hypothetical protein